MILHNQNAKGIVNLKLIMFVLSALSLTGCHAIAPERLTRIPLTSIAPGIVMVEIPSGQFVMGCNDGNTECKDAEFPRHTVNIATFGMSATEITFAQYDLFAVDTDRPLPDDEGWDRYNRPVIGVYWDDVVAYTKWLSAKTGQHFRLPTEAEWEYAARAGTSSKYNFGENIDCSMANYDDELCPSKKQGQDFKGTALVGSYAPNAFGLYDMHGNVQEWTIDCDSEDYSNAPNDGTANFAGDCEYRITRGGSWFASSRQLRSSQRGSSIRHGTNFDTGFRIVLDQSKPVQSSQSQ